MQDQKNDEISLREIIQLLFQHKLIVILITLIFVIIATLYAFLAKEVFSTTTVFITKTSNNPNSNLSSLASLAGISLGGNSNTDPSDYLDKVIQDKEFISKLLNRKWAFKGDSFYLEQICKIKKDTSILNWRYRYEKSKLDYIRDSKMIGIAKDKKTGILTLSVNAQDPQLTYDIAEFVISNLSFYIRNSIQSQAKEKREFIEERIKEVKVDLEKSENLLTDYKKRNISGNSPDIALEEMRLSRDVTLNQEVYIQFQKQYELALIEEKNDQTLIQVLKNPEIPIERSKPKRTKVIFIGLIIGFVTSILLVYIINWEKTQK